MEEGVGGVGVGGTNGSLGSARWHPPERVGVRQPDQTATQRAMSAACTLRTPPWYVL